MGKLTVVSILLVFFIVLITNLIDRDNFNRLSYSVTTMYEDRLVASDILFDISAIIKEKHIAILTFDTAFFNARNLEYNQNLNQLIQNYGQTKLTPKEKLVFDQLKTELNNLQKVELPSHNLTNGSKLVHIQKIYSQLKSLSKIQIQEGRRQVFISNKAKDLINLFTQGEICLLVIMAILIQVIILYKPQS